ncbi:hypothetical protein HZA57_08460 [Candidatus Poribacteria bacterium]|nr:hypothetical protein [Candidatus Poribacteria bacterium]
MPVVLQHAIVLVIVLAAVAYTGRAVWRTFAGSKTTCGCPSKGECQAARDLQRKVMSGGPAAKRTQEAECCRPATP